MADQNKDKGRRKHESNKPYGERERAGASGSEGSGPPREKHGWGRDSVRGKRDPEARWGAGSRGSGHASRVVWGEWEEGREAPRFGRSPHTSPFWRKTWWEQGGRRIRVQVRPGDPESPSPEPGATAPSPSPPALKQWFRITVPHGKRYDKAWLLGAMRDKCGVGFHPIEFYYDNNKAHFFVEGAGTASALSAINNNIIDDRNRRITILINKSSPPYSVQNELKPDQVEELKGVVTRRYDSAQKSLDLKGLRSDADLVAQNVDIVLSRKNFMTASVQIIAENFPELLSLNLSNNRLYQLDDFSEIVPKAPNLRILDLSGNELKSEWELDKVKGLNLDELWLEGNPLCKTFPDHASYLRAVRERFPKLLRLDGRELPPPIASDAATPTVLPSCKGSYFGSETVKGVLTCFLQQYYSVFDTGNRERLLDAYHEGACCSLSLPGRLPSTSPYNFKEYMKDNRNMKKLKEPSLRVRLLKHSRLSVVAFLNELPKTRHDLNSFVVDVCAQTETLLCFSVHGVFREVNEDSEDTIRAFTRVFVAAPSNNSNGMCMVNDELFLRNANSEEIRQAFASPTLPPTPSSCSIHTISKEQQDMVQSFSAQSGMNPEWSQKCLEDNNWNFVQAAQVFSQLNGEGKVPAMAFQK